MNFEKTVYESFKHTQKIELYNKPVYPSSNKFVTLENKNTFSVKQNMMTPNKIKIRSLISSNMPLTFKYLQLK